MAKRLTNNIITGNDPYLRMCLYYSPRFRMNIWRRGSTLTGERIKKDPAFKGFRQSISRLKEASPIAASLYKQVPTQVKQYALYRTLTGEAIKMLKEGITADSITETLRKKYIDPLLDASETNIKNTTVEEPVTKDRVKGMNDFTKMTPGVRKFTRTRRAFLLQKITDGRSAEYFSAIDLETTMQTAGNVSESTSSDPLPTGSPKRRTKTTDGLIYLGRLPECKKLKMWLRPVESSGLG